MWYLLKPEFGKLSGRYNKSRETREIDSLQEERFELRGRSTQELIGNDSVHLAE
jgi:hypothetical protein